jgi:hypothetical protein
VALPFSNIVLEVHSILERSMVITIIIAVAGAALGIVGIIENFQ